VPERGIVRVEHLVGVPPHRQAEYRKQREEAEPGWMPDVVG
jgi:hypothetical protein